MKKERMTKEENHKSVKTSISKESLMADNPWKEVVDELQSCIDDKEWHCHNEFICKGDKNIIDLHNTKCINKVHHKYITNTIPYAYSGNILNAKIVILTLNPGYIEFVNKTTFDMMKDESKARLYEGRIKDFMFESNTLIASNEDKLIGDRYWHGKLSSLWTDNLISEEVILKNIAIMQYVPYHSQEFAEYKSCGEIKELQSVVYNNKILRYLAGHSKCIFIIARKFDTWSKILIDSEVPEDRIVKLNSCRNTTISKGNMSDDDFEKIILRINNDY